MKAIVPIVAAAVVFGGCARFDAGLPGSGADTAEARVVALLSFADRLSAASSTELAAMPARRPAPVDRPHDLLRHALWLSEPGHAGYDPVAGRTALERLVARTDVGLDAPTRALVRHELRHLRARLELARERAELVERNARLREQIEALTALEQRMRGDEGGDGAADGEGSGDE